MEGGKEQNYWPGFVDALSNVVLTLVFVLVVFVFALMMASNKVEKKMQEVVSAEKVQKEEQKQLTQALNELQQLRSQESANDAQSSSNASQVQQQACVRFNKSDATQKAEVGTDSKSVTINFSASAISITDDTQKAITDFIAAYQARTGNMHAKFVIEAPEDTTSASPLLSRETQLGRMLNVRNSLLNSKVEAHMIAIHNSASTDEKTGYNWVKIHAEE